MPDGKSTPLDLSLFDNLDSPIADPIMVLSVND